MLSRRAFTSSMLAAPLGAARPGWIDAHSHVWTPDRRRYPLAAGFTPDHMKPASFTPEELLAQARPAGVERVVLIQISFYGVNNSYMLDSMARFPGMFSGVAVIDENDNPAATMRRLKRAGVRGFRIRPRTPEWLDGPGMAAMWKCGAAEGLAMCPLMDPGALPALDRMCRRHPETTVVIDHFARVGAGGEIREADVKQLCGLAAHPRVHVKLSAFYTLGKAQYPYLDLIPMIRRLYDVYGPRRLMWASDCPYQLQNGNTYRGSIELIRDRLDFLTPADRDWLLRDTAARVFFS
ncbi:MAG TPA: amidohydrolase family protein [Bryobacteraceae bacterium]|nr:amidohydrolase family protein [Bryobacteraceae bacterium]